MADIDIDDRAYLAGIPIALEEYRLLGEAFIEHVADKVVVRAKELAPKRTGELADSIHADPLVREPKGAYITVGTAGVREAVYMEFGTYKDRPHPFMRPALAEAAGGLRSIGMAVRLIFSGQARLFRRRAIARVKVQRAQDRRKNRLVLSAAEARATGRFISQQLRFRSPRRGRA